MQSETAMELYLESGTIQDETIREMIANRVLFPRSDRAENGRY